MTHTARAPREKLSLTGTRPRTQEPWPAPTLRLVSETRDIPAPRAPRDDVAAVLDPVTSHFGLDDAESASLAAFARKFMEGAPRRR